MFKDYYACRVWLESFIPQTYSRENLGLERIEYLLKLLGNPEKKFKSIHVGGTSGKGSTAFYIARLLQFSGYKIGIHLSPHLTYIGERMQINGKEISVSKFCALIRGIKPFVEQMEGSQVGKPSYFEILVALSFKYFADSKVDLAVVEVGLGGRFDATNVLQPEISVITNVGLDHTEILGNSVEKIAEEKAGIIKKNVPIVTGAGSKALKIIEKAAKAKKSPLIKINTRLGVRSLKSDMNLYKSLSIDIVRHTHNLFAFSNKLLAITAVSELKIKLSRQIVKKAFSKGLEGRLEEVVRGVILDGAHNFDKVRFLFHFVRDTFLIRHSREGGNLDPRLREDDMSGVVLVLAFKKGKNWKKMVDLLVRNLPVREIVATEFRAVTDTGRFATLKAEEIENYVKSVHGIQAIVCRNSQESVFKALNVKRLNSNQLILITGSLYLIGEARTLWYLPPF